MTVNSPPYYNEGTHFLRGPIQYCLKLSHWHHCTIYYPVKLLLGMFEPPLLTKSNNSCPGDIFAKSWAILGGLLSLISDPTSHCLNVFYQIPARSGYCSINNRNEWKEQTFLHLFFFFLRERLVLIVLGASFQMLLQR